MPTLEAKEMSSARRGVELGLLGLVSAFVIALQIVYIRSLSIASYHHFVYLVVSTALLGFGASGTLLAILGERADALYARISLFALVGFAASAPWALRLSAVVPIDLYYMLYDGAEAARLWLATLILALPFFAGGLFIGAVLRRRRARAGTTYAANLLGSGLGGVGVLPLLSVLDPERVTAIIGIATALSAAVWVAVGENTAAAGTTPGASETAAGHGAPADTAPAAAPRPPRASSSRASRAVATAAALLIALAATVPALLLPWEHPVDQYKGLAFARRLEAQGDATQLATARSPIARSDIYQADSMHYTLFASPGSPPPPAQLQVFRDGFLSGALFTIDSAGEADILDWLPQSLPYEILSRPDVLILGETSGVNVWLALRHGAASVTVVHRDPELMELLTGELADRGGGVFLDDRVTVIAQDPRNALASIDASFDLIHLADTEGVPAATAGLVSLQEDYLLTQEAIRAALGRLRPGGLLSATRGLQSPPRDNLRLFSLFAAALRSRGSTRPGEHLLQARNYLAATTVVSADPLPDDRVRRFVESAHEIAMDVDYFPGITTEDLTQTNRVEGPPGRPGSYLYHGARAIVRSDAQEFASEWVYRIDPPTDNRPYFHNFFRASSLSRYVDTYGQFWFSRVELGPVVVAATLVQAALAGAVLILLPVLIARRRRRSAATPSSRPPTGWTVLHFGLIGLGFMALEMLFIQKGTLVLGDPIYSAAATITAILVWAGLGSAVQGHVPLSPNRRITFGAIAVLLLGVATFFVLDLPGLQAAASPATRFALVILLLGPVSFSMGWLFPAGVAHLLEHRGEVGLALATNSVASVVAAPLAVLLSSSFGFPLVLLLALGCYGAAAVASFSASSTR